MTRRLTLPLLILSALFVMLAMPVVAQDEVSAEPVESEASAVIAAPTSPPLPTPIPSTNGSVVQGVFYFSPACGHCEYVIAQVLPGLFADNGGEYVVTFDESVLPDQPAFYLMSNGQLQLLMVDTTVADGGAMFQADSVRLEVDQVGVPRLDIEDGYLVGSGEIPDLFPGIVEEGLAGDGIAWPEVPGIDKALAPFIADGSVIDPDATPEPGGATAKPGEEATAAPEDGGDGTIAILPVGPDESPLDRIGKDPVGNGISIIVLIALVISLIAAPVLALRGSLPTFPDWLVIVLVAIGIAAAAYLASIETTGSEAVCGPVGDCNAVQESEYASLFGIPIGVLGVIGYLFIGGLWVVARVARGSVADWALVLVAVSVFGGTLFSTYLTFLEPFVIGATCMWCITSALVMMALLWITAGPGWAAWRRLRGNTPSTAPTSP